MLVYNIINPYLYNMEMPYNLISIPDKVFNLWKRGLDYTVGSQSVHGFILFILLIVIGFPMCMIITTPILLLAGIEHLLYHIMEFLDEVGDENKFKSFMSYTGIIMMIIPTLIFFGPGLIWHTIKERREKKETLNRERDRLERVQCDVQHIQRLQTIIRSREKDFKPKKCLVPHNFKKGKVIIPGVYVEGNMSTAVGYNSTAVGYNNVTIRDLYETYRANTPQPQPRRIRY